jgi:hypothetical protein
MMDHIPFVDGDVGDSTWLACSCGWDNMRGNRNWSEHLPDSLDAAWAEAEATSAERGLVIYQIVRLSDDPAINEQFPAIWRVEAGNVHNRAQDVRGTGPTPAAALRALAAKLRDA